MWFFVLAADPLHPRVVLVLVAGRHRQLVDVMVGRIEVVGTRKRQAVPNKKTPFQQQQQSSNKGESLVD